MDKPNSDADVLDKVINFWQPRYPDRTLTREDARQIIENVTAFFTTVQRWADGATDAATDDARARPPET